jgi:uncharacterized protein YcbX
VKLAEIRRYPVKAMGGELLDDVEVERRGLAGDRWFAVRGDDGRIVAGSDSHRYRRGDDLFHIRAATTAEGVRVEGAAGSWLVGDPALEEALATVLDARVRVEAEGEVSHQDDSAVSLVGTASLDWCREHLGVDADVRRIRANLLVTTTEPFVEESWIGSGVRIGATELKVTSRTVRCRIIDIAQDGLAPEGRWLKGLGRTREVCIGVYADVVRPGRISVGDDVEVVKDSPA